MKQSFKWPGVVLIWGCAAALAIFANPKISDYLAEWIAYGVALALMLAGGGLASIIVRVVMKYVIFGILLVGEVFLAVFVMTALGYRKKSIPESSPPS